MKYMNALHSLLLLMLCIMVAYMNLMPSLVGATNISRSQAPASGEYFLDNDLKEWRLPTAQQSQSEHLQLADNDRDGIANADELALGIDPDDIDSDCDYIDDGVEVNATGSPTDSDADGIIDALENRFADSDQDGINDETDPVSGAQVSCGRFIPFAIQNNAVDAARLELRIVGGTSVTAVAAVANQSSFFLPLVAGTAIQINDTIPLFDDGTHGDRMAGDGIWTQDQFTADVGLAPGSLGTFDFNLVTITDSEGVHQIDRRVVMNSTFADIVLGVVQQSDVQTPTLASANVQTVTNLVNLIDPQVLLAVKNGDDLKPATLRFYNDFPDVYDFLLFFPESPTVDAPFGQFFAIKNEVQHIGLERFDHTASFGSSGKLQGVIFLNFGANGPTLHEALHHWATYDLSALGFGQCDVDNHWGPAGVGRGQLGGFDSASLVDNGNGTYTVNLFGLVANGGDSVAYAPLERYLAGFADASTVAPIKLPVNVDCNSFDYSVVDKVTFRAASVKTVRIEEIMTQLGGARVPSFPNAQTHFRAALIVASQVQLNGAEMAFFNARAKLFAATTGDGFLQSFAEASGGVASMDTTIGERVQRTYSYLPVITK